MDRYGCGGGLPRACWPDTSRDELSDGGCVTLFLFTSLSGAHAHVPFPPVFFEEAKEEARKLDAEFAKTGELKGPLHGVPMSLKDSCELVHPCGGMPTEAPTGRYVKVRVMGDGSKTGYTRWGNK